MMWVGIAPSKPNTVSKSLNEPSPFSNRVMKAPLVRAGRSEWMLTVARLGPLQGNGAVYTPTQQVNPM